MLTARIPNAGWNKSNPYLLLGVVARAEEIESFKSSSAVKYGLERPPAIRSVARYSQRIKPAYRGEVG